MSERLAVFEPLQSDVARVSEHAVFSAVDVELCTTIAGHINEMLFGATTEHTRNRLIKIRERITQRRGDTLINPDIKYLALLNSGLSDAINELRGGLGYGAIDEHPTTTSIKIYTPTRNGKILHRDDDFRDSTSSYVDVVGLQGERDFALWAIPRNTNTGRVDDEGRTNLRPENRSQAVVEFPAELDDEQLLFRPVRLERLGPGGVVRIDEIASEWQQPDEGHQMSLWHSVYAIETTEENPAMSMIFRSPIQPAEVRAA